MKVKFFNISWDVDTDEDDEMVDLPTVVLVDDVDDDVDLEFDGADILSDVVGYCVNDFEYEIIEGE